MRRFSASLLCMLSLLLTSSVLAQKPTISLVYPDGFSILAPTKALCGFDTIDTPRAWQAVARKNHPIREWWGANCWAAFRPTSEHHYRTDRKPGPAPSVTFLPDGGTIIIGGGLSIWNFPPPPLSVTQAAGLPPVPYTKGRVKVVFDATGNITSMSLQGTAENICSLFN